MASGYSTVRETFLGKIPGLNIIEKIRVKIVEWVHKDETKGTEVDFVVKAAFMGSVGLLLALSTVGTLVYNLVSPSNMFLAWLLVMFIGGLGYKYFTDAKLGTPSKTEKLATPTLFVSVIFVTVLAAYGSPIFTTISDFVANLIQGVSFFQVAQSLLVAGTLIAKSQAANIVIPLMNPLNSLWVVVVSKYLADLGEYIYWEVRGRRD